MKRIIISILVLAFFLTGCSGRHTHGYKSVNSVGKVPDDFSTIVEENLFYSAVAFSDRVLRYESTSGGYCVKMYDFYGNTLASYLCTAETATRIQGLTATSDGGFLFALGFNDFVSKDGTWASENGVYSRIIKCDDKGNLLWDIRLENYKSGMLQDCIEKDGVYYFFGDQETPETDTVGVYSPTDIHIMKLSSDGVVLQTATISGSDYDSLTYVKEQDGKFEMYCHTQSSDGDFPSSGGWKIVADADLKILGMESAESSYYDYIGTINGQRILTTEDVVKNFTDGSLTAVLDYGDFYLTVSENITGIYEKTPTMISATWHYTETVYGAYDKEGNIIWKKAVDSSRDWDAIVDEYY